MDELAEMSSFSSKDERSRKFYMDRNAFRSKKAVISNGTIKKHVWRDYFFLERGIALQYLDRQNEEWKLSHVKSRFAFKSHLLLPNGNEYWKVTKTPLSRSDEVLDKDGNLVSREARSIVRKQEIVRGGRDYVVTSTSRLTGKTRSEIVSHKDQEAFEKIASGRASIGFGSKAPLRARKARSSKSAANGPADLKAAYDAIHNGAEDQLVAWRDVRTSSEIIQRGVSPEHEVLEPPAKTVPATGEYSPAALAAAYKEIHNEGDELVPLHVPEQIRQPSSLAPSRQTTQGGSGTDLSSASGAGRPRILSPVPVPQPYGQFNKPLPALPAEALGRGGAPSYNSWAIPANMNLNPPRAPTHDDTTAPLGPRPSTPPFVQPEFPQSHIASAMAPPHQSINGGLHRLTSQFTRGPDGALSRGPLTGPDAVGLTILQATHRNSLEQPQDGLGLDGGASAFASLQQDGGRRGTPHTPHMEMDGGAGGLSQFEQHADAQRATSSSSAAVPSHRLRGHQAESSGR